MVVLTRRQPCCRPYARVLHAMKFQAPHRQENGLIRWFKVKLQFQTYISTHLDTSNSRLTAATISARVLKQGFNSEDFMKAIMYSGPSVDEVELVVYSEFVAHTTGSMSLVCRQPLNQSNIPRNSVTLIAELLTRAGQWQLV